MSEPGEDPPLGGGDAKKHLRGSSVLLAGRLIAMVISMVTQVVLVRNLAKADYGAFAYGLSIADALVFVVGLGQSQALNRFLTLYDERDQTGRFRGAVVLASGTALLAGAVLAVVAWANRTFLEDTLVDDPTAVSVLLVFLLLTPLGALDRIGVAILAVMARARDIAFRKHLLVPVLRLVAAISLVPLGASVVRLAQAYVLIGLIGIVTYVVLIGATLRRTGRWERFWSGRLDLPVREVYGFALPLLTTELLVLSINAGSSVVLGLVGGTEEVARYRAVFPAARLNQLAIFTFTTLFIPLAARHFARNDDAGMRDSYRTTALWLGVLGLPIFLLTGPFASSTTGLLFGAQYDDAAPVMAILSGGYYLSTVLGFNAHTLQVYGRLRPLVIANVIAFLLNLGLTVMLGARYGAVGVAVSNGLALAVHNGINQWSLRRLLGPTLSSRPTRTVLTAIGGSVIVCGLVAAVDPPVYVAVAVAVLASLTTLRISRSHLAVLETFPEAAKIPGMRALLR